MMYLFVSVRGPDFKIEGNSPKDAWKNLYEREKDNGSLWKTGDLYRNKDAVEFEGFSYLTPGKCSVVYKDITTQQILEEALATVEAMSSEDFETECIKAGYTPVRKHTFNANEEHDFPSEWDVVPIYVTSNSTAEEKNHAAYDHVLLLLDPMLPDDKIYMGKYRYWKSLQKFPHDDWDED